MGKKKGGPPLRLEHTPQDPWVPRKNWAPFIDTLLKRDGVAIYRRLVEIKRTLHKIASIAAQIDDPLLGAEIRQDISWILVCLETARIRGVTLVQGMRQPAEQTVKTRTDRQRGSETTQQTMRQERNPIKQQWRKEAEQRWKKTTSLSPHHMATRLRDVGSLSKKDANLDLSVGTD